MGLPVPLPCSDSTVLDLWPGRGGPFSTWNLQRNFGTMVDPGSGSSLEGVPITMQVGAPSCRGAGPPHRARL